MQTDDHTDCADLIAWARQRDLGVLLEKTPEALAAKTMLNLYRDNLSALPEAIGCMKSLQRLDLRANPLERLPQRIGELRQLEMVDITEARITALPATFIHLHKLNYCRIQAQLAELPEGFGQLRSLTHLLLSENNLTDLPASMADLHKLEQLDLRGNRLTELPEWIGHLESLAWLDVRGNPLTHLPASLGESKALRHLAYDETVIAPPQLACIRDMANRPLGTLQATFAKMLSYYGYQLPEDDVFFRRRGQIGGEDGDYGYGDTLTYLFGQDERGEYLDYYTRHRIAGDQHIRIYEDGSWEHLEVISPFGPLCSDDPVENERLRREDQEEVARIRAMLEAKGFSSSY